MIGVFFFNSCSCISSRRSRRPTARHAFNLLAVELRALDNHTSSSSLSAPPVRRECVLCLDSVRNTRLWPCQHEIMCADCVAVLMSRDIAHCPICRADIEHVEEGETFGFATMSMQAKKQK